MNFHCCHYPVIVYLHAFRQDEQAFLDQLVERIDQAMVCGELPPCIVAVPDGSIRGLILPVAASTA